MLKILGKVDKNRFFIMMSLFFGCLLGLSLPTFSQGWYAWFAIAAFVVIINQQNSFKKGLLYTFLYALGYYLTAYSFFVQIHPVKFLHLKSYASLFFTIWLWIFQTLYVSAFFVFFGLIVFYICKIKNKIFLKSALITLSWIIILYLFIFPKICCLHSCLEYTQYQNTYFIQLAKYISGIGLTIIIVFINSLTGFVLSDLFNKRINVKSASIKLLSIILSVGIIHLIGYFIYKKPVEYKKNITVSLIQTNVTFDNRPSVPQLLTFYMNQINKVPPGIVILPEQAFPEYLFQYKKFLNDLKSAARKQNKTIVIGSNQLIKKQRTNIVVMIKKDKSDPLVYYKNYLLPFFESDKEFPVGLVTKVTNFLFKIKDKPYYMEEGKIKSFDLNGVKILPLICQEIYFLNFFKPKNMKNFDFIVNVGSLIWFHGSLVKDWYIASGVIRAVENDKPLISCINNGYSFILDSKGEMILKLPADSFETYSVEVKY